MESLAGKVALVTGAAKGMGKAIATLFAREGAWVIIAARQFVQARDTAQEIGGQAFPVALDVTDRGMWDRVVRAVDERRGQLDVLVNCAGISESATVEAVEEEAWRRHMATNLDGAFHGCRAALPLMRRIG
jgi:NAD(P)-dependent dehydrogenase (short-subunit alcohol dehydrogenase family)